LFQYIKIYRYLLCSQPSSPNCQIIFGPGTVKTSRFLSDRYRTQILRHNFSLELPEGYIFWTSIEPHGFSIYDIAEACLKPFCRNGHFRKSTHHYHCIPS
jgi:hypothetical protein